MRKKGDFHPRNRHQGRYDFERLMAVFPELRRYSARNRLGALSIDFTNPDGVRALNRALLMEQYGIRDWAIPEGFLCPAVPGRADYIHQLADLLSEDRAEGNLRGPEVRILDIGTGASCIFPIIAVHEYGWRVVGTDINPRSLESAQAILDRNPVLRDAVVLRLQRDPRSIFRGMISAEESFHAVLCNPPFHASPEEAAEVNRRKWIKMGRAELAGSSHEKQRVNFGGRGAELWCEGGEVEFLGRMVRESAEWGGRCRWFTTLVSKDAFLPGLQRRIEAERAREIRVIPMSQGQKKSRILAWTFQTLT